MTPSIIANPPQSWGSLMLTGRPGNEAILVGDSLVQNNWPTSTTSFVATNLEGMHEWANALLGQRFYISQNLGVGGKTAEQILQSQVWPSIFARPGYVFLSAGLNDLYNVPQQTGATVAARIIEIVQTYLNNNIVPIWSTVTPRAPATTNAARILAQHLDCNDRLRLWAQENDCGIFWDAFAVMVNPTDSDCDPRTGFCYDTPAIHPNNVGALYLGQKLAGAISNYVTTRQIMAFGAEDRTNTSVSNAGGQSNLLANPYFSGTGGTVSANCTGTMPDNWTIEWATRTGTGSAAAAIVDVADAETGLGTAKGVQITISGTPAANDEIRIKQNTGFNTLLSGGDVVSAEAKMTFASTAAVDRPRVFLFVNNTEQTNWGNLSQTGAAITSAFTIVGKTRPLTVLGTGAASAAEMQVRVRFSGDSTGTVITISNPRVRKVTY